MILESSKTSFLLAWLYVRGFLWLACFEALWALLAMVANYTWHLTRENTEPSYSHGTVSYWVLCISYCTKSLVCAISLGHKDDLGTGVVVVEIVLSRFYKWGTEAWKDWGRNLSKATGLGGHLWGIELTNTRLKLSRTVTSPRCAIRAASVCPFGNMTYLPKLSICLISSCLCNHHDGQELGDLAIAPESHPLWIPSQGTYGFFTFQGEQIQRREWGS